MTPSRWTYFTLEELTCRCGCGAVAMNDPFMLHAVALRDACGFPFPVTSGYRCAIHNAATGGVGDGPHSRGYAIDISVSRFNATILVRAALSMGFRGVGVKQHGPDAGRFVHIDDDPTRGSQILWTY
jgi:uncharacterized protein YcbK (DUF882 family)